MASRYLWFKPEYCRGGKDKVVARNLFRVSSRHSLSEIVTPGNNSFWMVGHGIAIFSTNHYSRKRRRNKQVMTQRIAVTGCHNKNNTCQQLRYCYFRSGKLYEFQITLEDFSGILYIANFFLCLIFCNMDTSKSNMFY